MFFQSECDKENRAQSRGLSQRGLGPGRQLRGHGGAAQTQVSPPRQLKARANIGTEFAQIPRRHKAQRRTLRSWLLRV